MALNEQMERVINPALAPPERAEQQYPIKDILETGAEISFGSDWPVCYEGHILIVGRELGHTASITNCYVR